MMHLKNITVGNPKTKEEFELTKRFGAVWFYSEDGASWYSEQKNFQPDTIKVAYDKNNVVVAISKDVSTINPNGLSVVEIPDITRNRRADISGDWIFKDGELLKRTYTQEEQQKQAENQKQDLLLQASNKTQFWQTQLALGIISDDAKLRLVDWMKYVQQVEAVDTSHPPVKFPEQPK